MNGHHAENAGFLNAKAGKRPSLLDFGTSLRTPDVSNLKQFEILFYTDARPLAPITASQYILKRSIG